MATTTVAMSATAVVMSGRLEDGLELIADQQRREADVNGRERLGPVRMLEQERLPRLERAAFGEDGARLRDAALFEHVVQVARGRPGLADHRVVQMADDAVVHVDDRGVRHAFRVDARFENGIEAGIGPEPRYGSSGPRPAPRRPGRVRRSASTAGPPARDFLQQACASEDMSARERVHGQSDDQRDDDDLYRLATQQHRPPGPPRTA